MSFYLYALTAEAPRGRLGKGIAREPVKGLPFGPFFAVTGEMDEAPDVAEASLRAHDDVVRRVAARMPAVLPMRFGAIARDEEAIAAILRDRHAELALALTRVEGCEQMTLRVFVDGARAPAVDGADGAESHGPGSRYLRSRAAALLPREIAPLRAELASFVRDERAEAHAAAAAPLVASVYHLVRRADRDAYLAAFRRASGALTSARVVPSGPWPAYAFAEAM